MTIISITDIESLILLKAKIEQQEKIKLTLEDFIQTYVSASQNLYTFLSNNGETMETLSILDYDNETYVFNINDLDENTIIKYIDMVNNENLKEAKMQNIDISKKFIVHNSKYYTIEE